LPTAPRGPALEDAEDAAADVAAVPVTNKVVPVTATESEDEAEEEAIEEVPVGEVPEEEAAAAVTQLVSEP